MVGQHCLLTEVLMWQMWKNLPCSVWESFGNLMLFLPLVADSAIYFVKIVFSLMSWMFFCVSVFKALWGSKDVWVLTIDLQLAVSLSLLFCMNQCVLEPILTASVTSWFLDIYIALFFLWRTRTWGHEFAFIIGML